MYTRSSVRGVPNLLKVGAWGIRSFPNHLCFVVSRIVCQFAFKKLLRLAIFSWLKLDTHNTPQRYFWQRSFIHEVGATVRYTLDASPAMDETSHILNLLAQGYCLDSWIRKQDC